MTAAPSERYRELSPKRVRVVKSHAITVRARPWQVVVEGEWGERVHTTCGSSYRAAVVASGLAARLGVPYVPNSQGASL